MTRKKIVWGIAGILLGAGLFLAGCTITVEPETTDESSDVDWTSHNTDYSILVRNNTSYSLVAFKGDLSADKLIGGIPAHATGSGHGLPYDPALFDKTEDFPMILLTKEQYEANKDDLSSQKNSPFTRVYVFFNKNGDNTMTYEIAGGLGGSNSLNVVNASNSINVELRVNGPAGETLGYAPAGILSTTLKLGDGNYTIFPVFKRYNVFRDVVETVYPKANNGYAWFQAYSFGEGVTAATLNLKELLSTLTITSGTAWLVVDNQTDSGGIRFMEGTNVHTTLSGIENIMSGNPRTFQIDMAKTGTSYADSKTVAGWKFGPIGHEVALQTSKTDSTIMESFQVKRDTMYTVTVTGNHNADTLKAWISSETPVDTSSFAW